MLSDPDVIHVGGKVDPLADIETIEMELMFADIQTLENALPKAERAAKSGDKEAKLRVAGIQQSMEQLNKEQPLRKLKLEETIAKSISSFGLMTAKPILYVANVDEDDLQGKGEMVERLRKFAEQVGAQVVPVCAKLEAEIAELEEPDRSEMLAAVGLEETGATGGGSQDLPNAGASELLHRWRKRSKGLDRSDWSNGTARGRSHSQRF